MADSIAQVVVFLIPLGGGLFLITTGFNTLQKSRGGWEHPWSHRMRNWLWWLRMFAHPYYTMALGALMLGVGVLGIVSAVT